MIHSSTAWRSVTLKHTRLREIVSVNCLDGFRQGQDPPYYLKCRSKELALQVEGPERSLDKSSLVSNEVNSNEGEAGKEVIGDDLSPIREVLYVQLQEISLTEAEAKDGEQVESRC